MLDYIHVFLVSVRGRILERGDVTLFLSSHVSRMFVRFVWSAGEESSYTYIRTTRRLDFNSFYLNYCSRRVLRNQEKGWILSAWFNCGPKASVGRRPLVNVWTPALFNPNCRFYILPNLTCFPPNKRSTQLLPLPGLPYLMAFLSYKGQST